MGSTSSLMRVSTNHAAGAPYYYPPTQPKRPIQSSKRCERVAYYTSAVRSHRAVFLWVRDRELLQYLNALRICLAAIAHQYTTDLQQCDFSRMFSPLTRIVLTGMLHQYLIWRPFLEGNIASAL